MFWFLSDGDRDLILMGSLLSFITGALCAAGVLAVGLPRGHQALAWAGAVTCLLVGLGCFLLAIFPAAGLILVMGLTEPIEAGRRRKRGGRAWADQDYTPAYQEPRSASRQPEPTPPKPPAGGVDQVPDIVDELPPGAESSAPVPPVHPVLAEIRAKLGPSPRWLPEGVLKELTVRRPAWVGQDELEIVLRDQRAVLAMGEVFWGVLVQAHPALMRPGPLDHPATLVYSRDAAVVRDPARLVAVAHRIRDLKHTQPESPGLRRFADLLVDDRRRAMRWDVPDSLTGGLSVYLTSVLVARSHLPGRTVAGGLVPVIVRYDTPAALVVPSSVWPRGFRVNWEEQVKKVADARPWLTIMPAAAAYLKRQVMAENIPSPWCLRVWMERDVDQANARIKTAIGPLTADPVKDRRFGGGGIVVVIPTAQEEEFRGVEIDVVTHDEREVLIVE
jgi:hypothetical protein